ncbi:MAG: DUF4160 domain-containing protein [Bacteroidota bacterium]|nr:DUF4160 domain-containing protein [Bacteroidota bacterium]
MLQGKLSAKQLRLVAAWIEIHREELVANWALCQQGEEPILLNL